MTLNEVPKSKQAASPWIRPLKFHAFNLQSAALAATVEQVPMENAVSAEQPPQTIRIPMPDGSYQRFAIVEAPVMHPDLAAQFPEIKTYAGQGIDDPHATVRLDWTPKGFHAQVLTPSGAVYVDPYNRGDAILHVSYYKKDYRKEAEAFTCRVIRHAEKESAVQSEGNENAITASGSTLRTCRLACAATGEFSAFHGSTVGAGLAAIVATVNRVVGVYEKELAIRMVLVANNNLIVYTNAGSDPYTDDDSDALISENPPNLNSEIGVGNFDIGHVFSTGGGGLAGLGVVCDNSFKAEGVTGDFSPIGDPFDIDFVAHEMGHQFGGDHTFNGDSGGCSDDNRNGSTAYEPGSGSTIQAYAGICGNDDLQSNSDPFFHFAS